jgi:hypothetical protein
MTLPRTPEALDALEEAICKNNGDLNSAARSLAVDPRHVHMWSQADPEVATRIRQAQMIGWAGLESAAYQRAVVGVEVPVYQKGEIVGYKTEYSDGLLSQMLKARVPGYSEATTHTHQHMVNVNLMPRASSYEEWQAQRESALAPAIEHQPPLKQVGPRPSASIETIKQRVRDLPPLFPDKLRDVL